MDILYLLIRDPYFARVAACRAVAFVVIVVKAVFGVPNDRGIDL